MKKASWQDEVLAFSSREFERRHRKIRELMQLRGIDCVIITGNTSGHRTAAAALRYVSGLIGDGPYILFPLVGEPVFLAASPVIAAQLEKKSSIPVAAVSFKKGTRIRDYATDLIGRIKDLGLEKGTIGIVSMRVMPVNVYLELRRELPSANFTSAGDLLLECRRIKSPEEQEFVRKAGECADKGIEAIAAVARPGVTEAELVAACDEAMFKAGSDRGNFILLGSGPWAEMQGAIGEGSRRKLQEGDIILNEITPNYGGHNVQLCVPISIGKDIPSAFVDLFKIHKEMYELAFKELRPGNTVGEIEAKVAELGAARGWSFRRAWALESGEIGEAFFKLNTELKPGMSYVVHPWTEFSSRRGFDGHTIGNTCIVTGGEPEITSKLPLEIMVV